MLTGDRDSFQLAKDNVIIRIPRTKQGKTEMEDFDSKKIFETYGVLPKQMIEVKGLMGDSSDNIPGVPGIGEKTALSLIQTYGSIDNIYENDHLYNLELTANNIEAKIKFIINIPKSFSGNDNQPWFSAKLSTFELKTYFKNPITLKIIISVERWNL